MVSVKLPDIMSGLIKFKNILSIRVSEWLVILVGCKIKSTHLSVLTRLWPNRQDKRLLTHETHKNAGSKSVRQVPWSWIPNFKRRLRHIALL